MFRRRLAPLAFAAACLIPIGAASGQDRPPAAAPAPAGELVTSRGSVAIHPVRHGSLVLTWQGRAIYVDPAWDAALYEGLPRADVVFVTDIHKDHMDPEVLAKVVKPGAVIVAPGAVRDKLPPDLQAMTRVIGNGGTTTVAEVGIEAVPMYNLTPDRLQNHPKGRGNGYVLTLGGKRVYIAGDTEDIAEMRALRGIDVAFVPMNLPYTMSVAQAAEAVRGFRPKVVYPYHYRGNDPEEFARLVGDDVGVEVRKGAWY